VVPGGSTFSYDSVGNRRDQGGVYGPGNRIRTFAGCTYVTDSLGDGNVLQRTCGTEIVRFHGTAESRLKALKLVNGDSLELAYDAAGRLVRRKVIGAAPPHFFLWQGDNLFAELDSATGKVAEYSYYPGLDNLHALITGTTSYFAHRDGIGNVIALTDSATTPSVQRSYGDSAWGALIGGTDSKPFTNADRARFKGALWLGPSVEVYYMRARWYEPKSGRFLSEDPNGLEGGINQYVYAADDPVNASDPSGREACFEKMSEVWALEREINADIDVEFENGKYCVKGINDRGNSTAEQLFLQWSLGIWAQSKHTFTIDRSWASRANQPNAVGCIGASLSMGANVVMSWYVVRGAVEVAWGIMGSITVGITGSVLGAGASIGPQLAAADALIVSGARKAAFGIIPGALTLVGVGGDVASGNFSWTESLVPIVGLGSAWNAVAANCPQVW
jgi:RHS repeat-associated protein